MGETVALHMEQLKKADVGAAQAQGSGGGSNEAALTKRLRLDVAGTAHGGKEEEAAAAQKEESSKGEAPEAEEPKVKEGSEKGASAAEAGAKKGPVSTEPAETGHWA